MKYALERMGQLVNMLIEVSDMKTEHEKKLEEIIELSKCEKENIRVYLLRRSLSIKKEKELVLLIEQYQAEVVRLMDEVFVFKSNCVDSYFVQVLDTINKDLEDVLSHLESRYRRYFNMDEKIPASLQIRIKEELGTRILDLKGEMVKRVRDEDLIKVLFGPLQDLINGEVTVKYKQVAFLEELLSELENVDYENADDCAEIVVRMMIYLNFNCLFFINYLFDKLDSGLAALTGDAEKLDFLVSYQKKNGQVMIKPNKGLYEEQDNIKDLVGRWISEEIYYLEKRQCIMSVSTTNNGHEIVAEEDKLHLSTSVEVLTILARAAKDSKLILNKQMTGMYRSIAKFCRTTQTDRPSPHSMLKKSYVAERSAKQTAVNILHEMVKRVHGY